MPDNKPKEDFYRPFIEIAASAYPGRSFEQVAAISDLYLCAAPPNNRNDSTKRLAFTPNSPCADLYFNGSKISLHFLNRSRIATCSSLPAKDLSNWMGRALYSRIGHEPPRIQTFSGKVSPERLFGPLTHGSRHAEFTMKNSLPFKLTPKCENRPKTNGLVNGGDAAENSPPFRATMLHQRCAPGMNTSYPYHQFQTPR